MSGITKINKCDIYISLNILYSMQGLLYPSGAINQLLQLLIILWGLIISFKYIFGNYRQTSFLKALSALVFMYCLYGGFLIIFGNPFIQYLSYLPPRYLYLQSALRSLLSIYVFHHYASTRALSSGRMRVYAIALLMSLIPQFYYEQNRIMFISGRDEVTNNIGYTFLSIMPMLFFFNKKPLVQYALLAIALLYIIMAMKRGAIAISLVVAAALLMSNVFWGSKKHRFWTISFTIILILCSLFFISKMMLESEYFAYRIEQTISGDSSGRDVLYDSIWQNILNETNLFYFLFGRGADSTWAIAGNYAHQDWLETLCNNGVIGGIVLLSFYVILLRDAYTSRKVFSKNYYIAYMALFFIAFSKTFFSMSIQSMEISLSLLLGYLSYWRYSPFMELAKEDLV